MSAQLSMFDRYEMWTLGMTEKCVRGRGECRYQPCTVANNARCCAACMMCGSPCPKVRKEAAR